ncbi:DivIVA domain-containing protein [Geodermatophilus telluris]|uniref:DivIVA domain-containing protein n=1 Tax=Geodermatophilus telluris TaxID=1190417 RepID=A0A1G6MHQ3_9ACTN|nr:DivIVA domain-containing protein [Geodermatophilus telluris]SDC54777.1 DivIVA domain-containing protein [Geodermatophilus telluris]
MLSFLVGLAAVAVVGALLFLGGSVLLGRGETQPPADPDRSPVELPDDRPVTGADVRALQIPVALRGYRMTEVDWLLEQLAETIEERDEVIAALRAQRDRPARAADADTDPGLTLPADGAPGGASGGGVAGEGRDVDEGARNGA